MCCNISAIHIWQGTVLARFAQDITANMDQSGEPTVVSARGRQTQQAQRIRIQERKNDPQKWEKLIKLNFLIFFSFIFSIFGHQNPGSGTGTRIQIHLKCWMLDPEPNPDPQHWFKKPNSYEVISFSCPRWDLLTMQMVCTITITRTKNRDYTLISLT
jgi:hypothetical protein